MSALPDAAPADMRMAFLQELAALSGLPPDAAQEWWTDGAVELPEGLPCRVRWVDEPGDGPRARVEVLLPLPAQALTGAEVARLLQWQAALFVESGWWLGLSPEGLIQIASLASHRQASLAKGELDFGHALVPSLLQALLGPGTTA